MKVVIVGASTNPVRYAYLAAEMLNQYQYDFVPVGIKKGEVFGQTILDIRAHPMVEDVDTITMYINPVHQQDYYDYFFALNPKRFVFNPGTENSELEDMAKERGIVTQNACTLVMLRLGNFNDYLEVNQ